jgi:hypothetical protein
MMRSITAPGIIRMTTGTMNFILNEVGPSICICHSAATRDAVVEIEKIVSGLETHAAPGAKLGTELQKLRS